MRPTPPPAPLTRDRLLALLDRLPSVRVAVVGDVMLDRYLRGEAARLSPEAPVPVVTVREHRTALGGAGNVAANVAVMGASCDLIGVVGDDPHADTIRSEMGAANLSIAGLVTVAGRPTTTKTRLIAAGQQVARIDEEVDTPLPPDEGERLRYLALDALERADVLLLQDYNKGVLDAGVIGALIGAARAQGKPVVVDPKYRHFFDFAGATVFKPNRRELESALGAAADLTDPPALSAALLRLRVDHMLVTLGGDGMLLIGPDGVATHIPGLPRPVYDVSGAGDTVTAWLGATLAAGGTVYEGAVLGNYAAGIEVSKPGVATVTPAEVLRLHEDLHDQIGRLRRGGVI